MGEDLFTFLPLSGEFGNVDKIGVRNREERKREGGKVIMCATLCYEYRVFGYRPLSSLCKPCL